MSNEQTGSNAPDQQTASYDGEIRQTTGPGSGPPNGNERMVHRIGGTHPSANQNSGYTETGTNSNIGLNQFSEFPSSPAGVETNPQRTGLNNILQIKLADTPGTSAGTAPPVVAGTTPAAKPTSNDSDIDALINKMNGITITEQNTGTTVRPPDFITNREQIRKMHHMELVEQKKHADTSKTLYEVVSILNDIHPDGEKLISLKDQLNLAALHAEQKAYDKLSSIQKAQKVVSFYKSPLQKPIYREPPLDYRKTFHRTSPREITSVTGLFDPNDPKADFQHVWSKLIAYGQSNYFDESEYKDALRYILQGDAYSTFLSFEQTDQSFDYSLEYFGQVYSKKRTLDADRQAVDKFSRLRDEPLESCMHRSQLAVDRLRHLYRPEVWPEIRDQMRKNILTQVISEETRRYIQMEEDETLETMGMPYELQTLISMANRYEKIHNKIPRKEMQTVFKVASGGLVDDQKLKSELHHLKKENFTDKNLLREIVSELLINPAMTKQTSASSLRDQRRTSHDDERRLKRRDSFNDKRNITVDEREPTKSIIAPARFKPEMRMDTGEPLRQRSPSPSPFQKRPTQPNERNRSELNQTSTRPPMDGRNMRYKSQDRYREMRASSRDNSKENIPDTAIVRYTGEKKPNETDYRNSRSRDYSSERRSNDRNRDYSSERRTNDRNRDYSSEKRANDRYNAESRWRDNRRPSYDRQPREYSQERGRRDDRQERNQNNNGYRRERSYSRDNASGYPNKYSSNGYSSNNNSSRYRSPMRNRSLSRDRREYYLRNTSPGGTRIIIDVNGVKYKKLPREDSKN